MTKSRPELRPEFIMYTAGGERICFKRAKFREIPQTSYRIFGHPPPPPPTPLDQKSKNDTQPPPCLDEESKI